jgi:hypothetical protein
MDDMDRELEELLAERRAANPRRTPDREPVGTDALRKVLAMTVTVIGLATLVLVTLLLLG